MKKGRVKWIDQIRGFGVIAQREKGSDVLFYCESIGERKCKRLREGDRVDFRIDSQGSMSQALNIRKIK